MMLKAAVVAVCASAAHGLTSYSGQHLAALKATTCSNMGEIAASVGFSNSKADPYPALGYDTKINYAQNCYAVFPNEDTRSTYRLENGAAADMKAKNVTAKGRGTVFLTHDGPCGVCSDLASLSVYIGTPDLTAPVKACGFKLIESNQVKCLEDIGFRGACTQIWLYNTKNTKKTLGNGGCLGTCLRYATARANEPKKSWFMGSNPCSPSECPNKINGNNACSDFQWQDGQYRLNPCLQCDECRSGPIFQKVAGRTRRASGVQSEILRPPSSIKAEVFHGYGMPTAPRSSLSAGGTTAAVAAVSALAGVVVMGGVAFRRVKRGNTDEKEPQDASVASGAMVAPGAELESRAETAVAASPKLNLAAGEVPEL
jgi:hypothetical protein